MDSLGGSSRCPELSVFATNPSSSEITRHAGAVVLALVGMAGCSSDATRDAARESTPRPSVAPGEFGEADCFVARSVSNFTTLDDRNLIVFAPGKSNAYHVQVNPPSPQLRYAESLGFESRHSRVCGYAGDELIIAAGGGPSRMAVTGVFRLDAMALEGLQARFGKAPPASLQQPQPGMGAEIERDLEAPPRN